jgi:hypothetical protein
MSDELRILFQNYMDERFPDTEMDEASLAEFFDVWMNGYECGVIKDRR